MGLMLLLDLTPCWSCGSVCGNMNSVDKSAVSDNRKSDDQAKRKKAVEDLFKTGWKPLAAEIRKGGIPECLYQNVMVYNDLKDDEASNLHFD